MALGTPVHGGAAGAASTSATTASFTPGNGDLVLAWVFGRKSGSLPTTPTISDSQGLSWIDVTAQTLDTGSNPRVSGKLFCAIANGSAMTVTGTISDASNTNIVTVYIPGAGVPINFGTGTSTTGDPSMTLATGRTTGNTLVAFGGINASNALTEPSGYTQLYDAVGSSMRIGSCYEEAPSSDTAAYSSNNQNSVGVLVEVAESASASYELTVTSAAVVTAGTSVAVKAGKKITAGTVAIATAGSSISLKAQKKISVSSTGISLSGTSVAVKVDRHISVSSGTISLTPTSVSLKTQRSISVSSGAVSLSGSAVNLKSSRKISVTTNPVTLTGSSVSLVATRKLSVHSSTNFINLNIHTWGKEQASTIASQADPDGGNNAVELRENTATGYHDMLLFWSLPSGQTEFRVKLKAKANGRNLVEFYIADEPSWAEALWIGYDLRDGTINYDGGSGTKITYSNIVINEINDGWFELGADVHIDDSIDEMWFYWSLLDDTATGSYTGDGTSGMYFYQPQMYNYVAAGYDRTNLVGSSVSMSLDIPVTTYELTVTGAVISLDGSSVDLEKSNLLSVDPGAITLSGSSVFMRTGLVLSVSSGAIATAGSSVAISHGHKLSVSTNAVSSEGQSVGLYRGLDLTISSAAVTISGASVNLRVSRSIYADSRAITLSGESVYLTFSGAEKLLGVFSGAMSLVGSSVNLKASKIFTVDTTGIALEGSEVSMVHNYGSVVTGSVIALTGSPVGVYKQTFLTVSPANIEFYGYSVGFKRDYSVGVINNSITIGGSSVIMGFVKSLSVSTGTVILDGSDVEIFFTPVDPGVSSTLMVWDGTQWITGHLKIWNGIIWANAAAQRWTGYDWQEVA